MSPPSLKQTVVQATAVVVLALLPYLVAGVSPEFILLDDNSYIYENPQVLRGLTPQTALWALTSTEEANWYPLRRLSHLLDVSLFGLDARMHHLVSLGWHAAAALLLFLALRSLTGAAWRSFAVAGLFAAHPIQVESVAWAAERSNVLAAFIFTLTLLLWTRHARSPSPRRYVVVLLCCAIGLAAKPVLVTLPLLLLLLDFWPLGRMSPPEAPPWRIAPPLFVKLMLEKAPLLLLSAVAGGITVVVHRRLEALLTLEDLPFSARLANAAVSYWRYLGKLLWPADLAVFYPHPGTSLPMGTAALAAALLAAATALTLLPARRRPWLSTGWLWFAGMLFPMIGLVQFGGQAMADRFVYLPSIGIFLALVWLAAEGLPALLRQRALPAPPAGVTLLALTAAAAVQAGFWGSSETLFRHTLSVTEENWTIENNLAIVFTESGRPQEALGHAREAVRIMPDHGGAWNNLGLALAALGKHEEAIECYHRAARLGLDSGDIQIAGGIRNNLGLSLAALGRHEEAVMSYREAIRTRPDYPKAWSNLGLALAALRQHDEAARSFVEALRFDPDNPEFLDNLGISLAVLRRHEEAVEKFREAIRIAPGFPEAWYNLGVVLSELGRRSEAAACFREALRLRPDYRDARRALAIMEGVAP